MPVQAAAGTVIPHRGPGIGVRGGFLHIPQRHPSVQCRGNERVPQRMRPDRLADPGSAGGPPDDPRRTVAVQPPAVRSQEDRPIAALADGQVDRPGGARRSGMMTTLPPLRLITRVRCPCSTPSRSMFAPVASETRSPFRASSEISACSAGRPSPAATSSAPSSLRSSPWHGTHNPRGACGHARRVNDRAGLLRRRICRTRRWCTGGG